MRRHIASGTGIDIVMPGAADAAGFFGNNKIRYTGLAQFYGGSNSGKSRADN